MAETDTKPTRVEAIAARRKLYAALGEIDRLLADKSPDAAEKLRPYVEAAKIVPG